VLCLKEQEDAFYVTATEEVPKRGGAEKKKTKKKKQKETQPSQHSPGLQRRKPKRKSRAGEAHVDGQYKLSSLFKERISEK